MSERRRVLAALDAVRPSRWVGRGWIVLSGVFGAVAFVATVASAIVTRTFRGHSVPGLVLGVGAVVLVGVAGLYSARKRALQELAPGRMDTWLDAHVALGALAGLLAGLHAGNALTTPRPSTGWALLLVLFGLVASGAAWRLVYGMLPARLQPGLRHYSAHTSARRAAELQVELEKLAAGSPALQAVKDALLAGDRAALDTARAAVDPGLFARMEALDTRRRAHLARMPGQRRAAWALQGWRWLHLPLTIGLVVLFPLHLVGAFDLPARVLPFTAHAGAGACVDCHAAIVQEWSGSMHAHALTSPVTIVQTNVAVRETLGDQARVCVNCHGPVSASFDKTATLPFVSLPGTARDAGIDCVACHQLQGALARTPTLWEQDPGVTTIGASGSGASEAFQDLYLRGHLYLGNDPDPVGNGFHRSAADALHTDPGELCASCHDVHLDLDGDGRSEKGHDLVLQTLFQEWEAYRARGGASCVDCHMPATDTPSADARFGLVDGAVTRHARSHTFVGTDYPLDAPVEDTRRAEREALLTQAATLRIVSAQPGGAGLQVRVRATNVGVGHNLPSGFAFARQLWVELVVRQRGRVVFSSGVLADDAADLCDSTTLGGALGGFVQGCTFADPQLVNLQGELVTAVEPTGARDALGDNVIRAAAGALETPVQTLTAGAVARTRPADGRLLTPLEPGQSAEWAYDVPVFGPAEVSARLRFRNLPPYFVRALDARRQPGDGPDLSALVGNLQVVDMAEDTVRVP